MKLRRRVLCLCCIFFSLCFATHLRADDKNGASSAKTDVVSLLVENVPADFSRFAFANHPEQADLLTHFLWYHFHHRLSNSAVMFNKEYLLTADIWLGNASPRGSQESIQDIHRRVLLGAFMDEQGYVSSHQHFSQAHDLGWPFPSWDQAHRDLAKVKGKAFGWHFQPLKNVRGWTGGNLRRSKGDEYTGEAAAALWELHRTTVGIWRPPALHPA